MLPLGLLLVLDLLLAGVSSVVALDSLPAKSVVEYALPAAAETHEIVAISDKTILISQQTDGSLVKVSLDSSGKPTGARKWTPTNMWSGLHGLSVQTVASGNTTNTTIWATTQFDNTILHIDPNADDINSQPSVLLTIPVPSPAHGPHGILVNGTNLWIACKDSSHVVRISINNPSDYQVWSVSGRPIFVAVHPTSGDVYSGLDLSSKIWHYKNDGGAGMEIAVPSSVGSVPVGLVAGADGNAWVALLGTSTTGTGSFGRINKDASIDWFTMTSSVGAKAGIIHIAFSTDPTQLYLLGSSTVCAACVNAVFTVKIDNSTSTGTASPRIAVQNSIVLPTQYSWTHRILYHLGGLYVTELTTSTLAHVTGAAAVGLNVSETWDQFADWGLGIKTQIVGYY